MTWPIFPVPLKLGAATQTVEVSANASPLNFQNAVVQQGIAAQEITALPLEVAGAQRNAPNFLVIMPGVNTIAGGQNQDYAQINGGEEDSDEAVLDGVSMIEGLLSQSGTVAIEADFPISPDAVGEISLLTSNYDPQYGDTYSAVSCRQHQIRIGSISRRRLRIQSQHRLQCPAIWRGPTPQGH